MDKTAIAEAIAKMNLAFKLDRKITGVRFLFDADEFRKADARVLSVIEPDERKLCLYRPKQ